MLGCAWSLSGVQLFATLWTTARQAPLSMGILQARILEWVAMPSSMGSSQPGMEPRSPALQADSLLSEPPGKPKNTGVVSLSPLQWIFPTQELNQIPLQADSLPAELPGKPPGFADPPLIMKRYLPQVRLIGVTK